MLNFVVRVTPNKSNGMKTTDKDGDGAVGCKPTAAKPTATAETPDGQSEPTVREVVQRLRGELIPMYGRGETDAMIRLIFEYLKGWSPVDIIINDNKPMSRFVCSEVEKIVARLHLHEPIQYIIGHTYFYGMKFNVGPGVLIPRPETEELVDIIVQENKGSDLRVLDLCSGSGCIAIALARNLRFPVVEGLEFSEKALGYARRNATLLRTRVKFIEADIFSWEPAPESLDIIVSNPPYVDESEKSGMEANVLDYEPHEALFVSDDDPLRYYKRIADIAVEGLADRGRLYLEINPRHAEALCAMLSEKGLSSVRTYPDLHGRTRFVSGTIFNKS